MLLNKVAKRKIKWAFQHYHTLYVNWVLLAEDTGSVVRPLNEAGVMTPGPGDPTGAAVVAREEKTRETRLWLDVVEETAAYMRGTSPGEALRRLYFEGQSVTDAAEAMFVSAATIYRWRGDIFDYAFGLACQKGLLQRAA